MKTKIYFGIFLLELFFSIFEKTEAQSSPPPWIWAKAINRTIIPYNPSIAVDPSGNGDVYTTGVFFGSVDFDPGKDSFIITSTGFYNDAFISKLDGSGNFVWAKSLIAVLPHGGTSESHSIAIDPSGSSDVYITGGFYGAVDFDPGLDSFTLEYSGNLHDNADIFITKLDSSGHFIWAKRMGGTGDAFGRDIAVDPSGNGDVYTIGLFKGTIDFNPGADSFFLTSAGDYDVFISKLDSSGNFVWAKRIGGTGFDISFSLIFDPAGNGNVYTTGDFTGRVDFDPGVNIYNLNSVGVFDIFIIKLNSSGDFEWAKPMFGTHSLGGAGLSIDFDPTRGDIYTTGYFEGTVDFDPGKGIFNLYSHGGDDVFISKLDREGNFQWVKQIGGTGDDEGRAIAFDPAGVGGVYFMGNCALTVDFNPGPADTFNLTSGAKHGYFISKLNGEGNFQWAKLVRGPQPDQGASIALNAGSLYTSGLYLNPSISFDSIFLTNEITTEEFWDVFIAKLDIRTTSLSNVDYKNIQLNIYPNPTPDQLTIELGGDECFNVGITLYTILGEIIFSSPVENISHQKTIDISSLTTGIYFMELNIDGNRIVRKVVKE